MSRLLLKSSAWLVTMLVCLTLVFFCIPTVLADTNGQELLTGEPGKLIVQLGAEWAGTAFELKTDVGLYPQPIVVSPEGILSMELGGSKTYTLSALNSGQLASTQQPNTDTYGEAVPPNEAPSENSEDTDQLQDADELNLTTPEDDTAETDDTEQPAEPGEDNNLINGIPNMHLFLFAGGIILCVTGLIIMRVMKTRGNRRNVDDAGYDDDDY